MKKLHIFILSLCLFGLANAQVSNVKANFSCPGQVTVTYDLNTNLPTDATLYYSHDRGKTWLIAQTVSGDLTEQTSGTGKTISWNNTADNVRWGNFKLKVEVPEVHECECKVKSTLTDPPYNGWITFMCYNLGADPNMTMEEQMAYTPSGNTDATVYGDLYQWGRPTDGHEKRNSTTTATLATTNTPNNPYFIVAPFVPCDWRISRNDNLWGDGTQNTTVVKAANDPCPCGWRVPTQEEWGSIFRGGTAFGAPGTATANTWTWNSSGTAGYKISPDNGVTYTMFLPTTGYRGSTNGSLDIVGTYGYYWSSTVNGANIYYLDFFSSTVRPNTINCRAYGRSVRCVRE